MELEPAPGLTIARVGDRPISVEEIVDRIRQQGRVATKRYTDSKRMRQFIEDQVRFELLAQAALERGLDRDPDVVDAARKVMVRKLLQRDLAVDTLPTVADTAVQRYYQKHSHEYMQPEKRRIAEIRLAPTVEGQALAQSLIVRLQEPVSSRSEELIRGAKRPLYGTWRSQEHPDMNELFRALQIKHGLDKQQSVVGIANLFKTQQQYIEQYGPR